MMILISEDELDRLVADSAEAEWLRRECAALRARLARFDYGEGVLVGAGHWD